MVRNAMKKGLPRSDAPRVLDRRREARCNVVRRIGSQSQASRFPRNPSASGGADGLRGLSQRLERHAAPIRAAIESMNGARFVHDRLELAGWQVEIADAQKV